MKAKKIDLEMPVLKRVVRPKMPDLSAPAARALLKLTFDAQDRERMHELTAKNNAGTLQAEEQTELERYLRLGHFLDLVHAKARLALKKAGKN